MGGNKDDKKKQADLEKQQAADRALFLQSYQKAEEPSPLQSAWEKQNLNYLNWENGEGAFAGKPIDVMNAPGLGPEVSLYNHAREGQQGERQGIGALRLGLNASDPGLAANMAEQNKLRREQDASGQLENAVAMKTAEAHNSVMPLAQLDTSRNLSLAGMAGNQAQGSQSLWANYRPQPGFFRTFSQNLAGTLGQTLGGRGPAYT
jgi:hypothetical protein